MNASMKRFFSKGRGKDRGSGNHGPANDPPLLDSRGDSVQSHTEEHINQSSTASGDNKYVAPSPFLYLDLSLVSTF